MWHDKVYETAIAQPITRWLDHGYTLVDEEGVRLVSKWIAGLPQE